MSILIPKYRNCEMELTLPQHQRFKGEIRAILRDEMGNVKQDTGWIPNLLTNQGVKAIVNPYGVGTMWNAVHVGSSNQAPAVTDTALVSWLGAENSGLSGASTWATAPNYEFSSITGGRFNAGNATGTIREMGLSYYGSNQEMSVRTLVTPEISKSVDQVLDVYHRLTCYPDISTRTGQLTIYGEVYDWEMRPARMTDAWYAYGEWTNASLQAITCYEGGAFGTIETVPTGSLVQLGGSTESTLSATTNFTGTEWVDSRTSWGLDYDGLIDFLFSYNQWTNTSSSHGNGWQMSITKNVGGGGVTKLTTQNMWIDLRSTASRYP